MFRLVPSRTLDRGGGRGLGWSTRPRLKPFYLCAAPDRGKTVRYLALWYWKRARPRFTCRFKSRNSCWRGAALQPPSGAEQSAEACHRSVAAMFSGLRGDQSFAGCPPPLGGRIAQGWKPLLDGNGHSGCCTGRFPGKGMNHVKGYWRIMLIVFLYLAFLNPSDLTFRRDGLGSKPGGGRNASKPGPRHSWT